MINAVIIDDELNNIANLQALLQKHCPEVNVLATGLNADEGRKIIKEEKPALVFLDIQMPKENGFDLLASITDRNFEVIFFSAHDNFGINAIKFAAIDYLLKPVDIQELRLAVGKAIEKASLRAQNEKLENLIQILEKYHKKQEHKIALPSLKETQFIEIDQIVRCESSNNYTTFVLTSKKEIVVTKPLFEYEEFLADYGFFRCHQSHLINKKYIKSIVRSDGGYLIMHDNKSVPISRQKRALLKSILNL